ncbi:cadmium-translocating P-type ATPase [Candidatus Saccharibacteria bacterium]|nr:cadmium-translocating P-type ATPase [Candidatus Saccharibacteria bacterium]MCB9835056.1 cadmium-translocating P-type ATPase [Candidatus Nomurabacteria bacterium]
MKKIINFSKEYPFVAGVMIIIILAIILDLAGLTSQSDLLLGSFSILMALRLSTDMLKTLKEGRYGIDILAVVAIISTVAVGEYWASIVIVLMLTGGEALEDYASGRAQRELNALLDRAPKTAHLVTGDKFKTVALSTIKPGDILLVKPGEVIPVDAILLDQSAEFDESSLTGESLPVEHHQGEALLSGSINGGEAIRIEALRSSDQSQYQQIIELVKSATGTEAPFVRLADRYAVPFTLISFTIAGIAWISSGEALRFAQVLVVATPCPLLLGAPIALVSGMSRAAKHGIIVKSGSILERLATIKSVAFDKTGTLTSGEPVVSLVNPQPGFKDQDILLYAASAEQQSAHILARALVSEAINQKLALVSPKKLQETTAYGVSATIEGKKILVGKHSFLTSNQVDLSDRQISQAGETIVYVAIDQQFAGTIAFRDQVRPETKQTLANLKSLGINSTLMLTGDNQATARRIAKEIGIVDFQADCLPIDKVNAIKNAPIRPIMMVGDGVNDAPVLASADVGLAMGARGSTAASETADVVVLVDDLSRSYQAIQIAKDTMQIATQSIWIGIAISVGLMLIASTGVLPAVVGAGLQEVVDVVVMINALRAHGSWRS